MQLTAEIIQRCAGCTMPLARLWLPYLAAATSQYEITSRVRFAHFIAQVGHESASLTRTTENLNYSLPRLREVCEAAPVGSRWRSLLPRASQLAQNPQALANAAYAGRMGNGDEMSGDGWRYRGRGLLQNTGKANYEGVRDLLRESLPDVPDLVAMPDALSEPRWAAMAAAAFWHDHDLNALADAGEFRAITKRVNGGNNGAPDRLERFGRAMQALA